MENEDVETSRRIAAALGRRLCLAGTGIALASIAGAAPPVTVSPGGVERVERSASRCPTFSWGAATGVEAWELAVYRLAAEATVSRSRSPRRSRWSACSAGSAKRWATTRRAG